MTQSHTQKLHTQYRVPQRLYVFKEPDARRYLPGQGNKHSMTTLLISPDVYTQLLAAYGTPHILSTAARDLSLRARPIRGHSWTDVVLAHLHADAAKRRTSINAFTGE